MVCAGCDGTSDVQVNAPAEQQGLDAAVRETDPRPAEDSPDIAASAVEGEAIDPQPVDYAGLMKFIESHRGHPVVLDVWSTSCEPCIKELPNLVKLRQDYQEHGVVSVSLNIDYTGAEGTTPEEARERALPILEALGIHVHNLYSMVPDRELFQQPLFKENRVYAIPAILVFDRAGKVVATLGEAGEGASPYDQVRSTIDAILKS
jgi:thiol-disulfide isomerase/thioredoxin